MFQSLAGPGYFMPAEPEMPSEPELRTPPDTKRHELVVFNPGEVETGGQETRIHDEELFLFSCGERSPTRPAETTSYRGVECRSGGS